MASNASHCYLPFHKFYCLSLSGSFPRSLASILILIHLHIPNSLNKLGELAVSEILHIKIVVLIVDPVAEFADPDSLSACLMHRLADKFSDLFPGLGIILQKKRNNVLTLFQKKEPCIFHEF